jgi:hypothetical protein
MRIVPPGVEPSSPPLGVPAPSPDPRFRWVALSLATAGHAFGSVAALAVAPLAPFLLDAYRARGSTCSCRRCTWAECSWPCR